MKHMSTRATTVHALATTFREAFAESTSFTMASLSGVDLTAATHDPDVLQFYIIGNNISHSLSPTIHNVAFAHYGLAHHYSIPQTPNIVDDSVLFLIHRPEFGGASVTYPHKLAIQPLLHSLSPAAIAVGAVNTVIVPPSHKAACSRVKTRTGSASSGASLVTDLDMRHNRR